MENKKEDVYYLVGDIGGTNVRLELKDTDKNIVKNTLALTTNFSSLEEALILFIDESKINPEHILACISIAGKVTDNCVKAHANIVWPLADGIKIKEHLSTAIFTKN